MGGDAINYATMIEPGRWTWQSTSEWPLTSAEQQAYYFAEGPSGSVSSVNDGVLSRSEPGEDGRDLYRVDRSTTTGQATRWDNGVGVPMAYPDLGRNDAKGLAYTSPPLDQDVNVTGHPVVTLYVTASSGDADIYVYLEEVTPYGTAYYVTEGILRASHRALADPPYDVLGLPYHRSYAGDAESLPQGQPTALVFDLIPTSNVFNVGNHIRVTITGADADNTELPAAGAAFTVYRGGGHLSNISLPVVR